MLAKGLQFAETFKAFSSWNASTRILIQTQVTKSENQSRKQNQKEFIRFIYQRFFLHRTNTKLL
jgi:hypothetical protein